MALNAPDIDEFYERFPLFDDGRDEIVEALLLEAQRFVQDTWNVDDQKVALLYLTAHLLVTESKGAATQPGAVSSESFGPMSRSYAVNQKASRWELSEYGRRYADIAKRNTGGAGIAVVGGVYNGGTI